MLGEITAAARALGRTFSRTIAAFVATGRPPPDQWGLYDPAHPETIRHFA